MVRPGPHVNNSGNHAGDSCDHSSVFGFPVVITRCISATICIILSLLAKETSSLWLREYCAPPRMYWLTPAKNAGIDPGRQKIMTTLSFAIFRRPGLFFRNSSTSLYEKYRRSSCGLSTQPRSVPLRVRFMYFAKDLVSSVSPVFFLVRRILRS